MPNTYTFKELSDFVLAQKDDRIIAMHSSEAAARGMCSEIGCILVHFARKRHREKVDEVGYSFIFLQRNNRMIRVETDDHHKVSSFIQSCFRKNIKNYRQAKELLPAE